MIVQSEFDFARALKSIRKSRGMTQRDVGEAIGVDANVVSNWEIGLGKPRRMETFRALCIALNCPPGDLLGLSPSELSGDEYSLIKGFRRLNDAGRFTMMAMLDAQLTVSRSDPTPEE